MWTRLFYLNYLKATQSYVEKGVKRNPRLNNRYNHMLGMLLRNNKLPDLRTKVEKKQEPYKPRYLDQKLKKKIDKIVKISELLENADQEIIEHKIKKRENQQLTSEARMIQEFFSSWANKQKDLGITTKSEEQIISQN